MTFFIRYLWEDPRFFIAWFIIVVLSICCHEYAHARVALHEGDSTAADNGHLTFNPFKQMGLWSLLTFALVGIAWGQVPVNSANYRRKYSDAIVSAAGPLTNLVLGFAFGGLMFLCIKLNLGDDFAWKMLFYGGVINIALTVLNLLPIPGFDGWAILLNLKPDLFKKDSEWIKGSFFVAMILVFMFFNIIFSIGEAVIKYELELLAHIFG
ncbi:MAG: site-2 protease family protein [Lentisphaeria bacterium]|nr:site-2 protease family protein [Lentisphaeria bacterium]